MDLIYHGTSSDDSARKKSCGIRYVLIIPCDRPEFCDLIVGDSNHHVGLKVFMELHGRVLGQDPSRSSSRSTDPKKGWLEPSFLLCDTKTLSFWTVTLRDTLLKSTQIGLWVIKFRTYLWPPKKCVIPETFSPPASPASLWPTTRRCQPGLPTKRCWRQISMTTAFSGKTQKGPWRRENQGCTLWTRGEGFQFFQVSQIDENLEVHW